MAIVISEELKKIISDKDTLKVVSTVGKNGVPHVVYKGSLHVNEDGNIEYYELLESAKDNQNFIYSLWFDKKITINILSKDRKSFEIIGKPVRSITSGKKFLDVYAELKKVRGNSSDLGAIQIIEAEEIREETYSVRKEEDEEAYPILKHIDRLLKEEKED